jgi:hypothetical protein
VNIKSVHDLKTFLSYASQNLNWDIDPDDINNIDDLTYLGLKKAAVLLACFKYASFLSGVSNSTDTVC